MVMNICIFGAVAWADDRRAAGAVRRLAAAVLGGRRDRPGALVLAVLTFEDAPPADPSAPRDLPAIALAAVGCVAAFYGASELLTHPFIDGRTIAPLLGGLATIIVLIVYQFRASRPLLTIRAMLTSTIPVAASSWRCSRPPPRCRRRR